MNYATVGDASSPALLLIPGQTESWWGYEKALPLLAEHFQAFAVDLRGQGRSTRTPGRYTLDNIGNDLVRFIDTVIGRPTIVSGLSSGGVLSAWLSAYAKPGQVHRRGLRGPAAVLVRGATRDRARHPPGHRPDLRPVEHVPRRPVVDRRVGRDARGARRSGCPDWLTAMPVPRRTAAEPQGVRPRVGTGVLERNASRPSCDHERMLRSVKVPVLLTHHFRIVDEATGDAHGRDDRPAGPARPGPAHRGRRAGRVPVVPDDGPRDARRGPAALRRHRASTGSRRSTPDEHRSHGHRDPDA